MTLEEKQLRTALKSSIEKELKRTHPRIEITSKYPVTKCDKQGIQYDALYGKDGDKTVLVLHRQSDFMVKVTDHPENYKNVK